MNWLKPILDQILGPYVATTVVDIVERLGSDEEFKRKLFAAREKARNAANPEGARNASSEIHKLLRGD